MTTATDGRRARGDASRRAILGTAADLASVEGLDGVTIGTLAGRSGHGKSSIATLFGSKEALQLATVATAAEVFRTRIVEPARELPRGVERVATLLRGVLDYSQHRVFTGGCFFAAASADLDSKPGAVADAVRDWMRIWHGYVESQLRYAVEAGELAAGTDVELLAFELLALSDAANTRSLLGDGDRPYRFAAAGIRERLLACGADAAKLSPLG